ncbi:hypothetical protein Tco_0527998 [Tanacetum coccineum]
MGSRPADTNAAPKARLRASLFATSLLMTNTQTPPPATTVVIPTGAPATNTVANHAERPEKFNEHRGSSVFGLQDGDSKNVISQVQAWKHSDFLCHNYVLNGLIDPLYNVYCKTQTPKILESWNANTKRDAGTKQFVEEDNKLAQKTLIHQILPRLNMVDHAGSITRSSRGLAPTVTNQLSEVLTWKVTNNSGWWIILRGRLVMVVLIRNQMYVGKGYAVNAMFKLNVMVVKNDINKMNSSAYLIESSNVWHGRLGHNMLGEAILRLLSLNKIARKEKERLPYELYSQNNTNNGIPGMLLALKIIFPLVLSKELGAHLGLDTKLSKIKNKEMINLQDERLIKPMKKK